MKISSAKLKQIIKEEIEALGEMDVSSAEDYRQKIEGFAEMVRMVTIGRMPEMLKKSLEDSVKFSVEDVLNHISDDSVRDGVEEMVVDLLGQEYLPQSTDNMDEALDPDVNASYEAAMDQLDLVMKGMSVDQVLNVVKDYLEVGDLEMIIRKMPSAEAEEIFDTLRKMSK